MKTLKSEKDFISQIGKRIYRNDNGCPCNTCRQNKYEGLIVMDKQHAQYLAMTASDYVSEGMDLNYHTEEDHFQEIADNTNKNI